MGLPLFRDPQPASILFPLQVNQEPESFSGQVQYPQILQPSVCKINSHRGLSALLHSQEAMIYRG